MKLHGNEPRHPFTEEGIAKIDGEIPGMYILEAQEEGKSAYEIYKIGSSASNVRSRLMDFHNKLGLPFSGITLSYRHEHFKRGDFRSYSTPQRLLNEFRKSHEGNEPLWQHLT